MSAIYLFNAIAYLMSFSLKILFIYHYGIPQKLCYRRSFWRHTSIILHGKKCFVSATTVALTR